MLRANSQYDRRWPGHEGAALMNGIGAFIRETPECSLVPSARWRHSETMAIYEPENKPSPDIKPANAWSWTSQPLELWEMNVSCLNHPVYGNFVIAPKWTKTSYKWNHVVCNLWRLASFTQHNVWGSFKSVHVSILHFFLLLSSSK